MTGLPPISGAVLDQQMFEGPGASSGAASVFEHALQAAQASDAGPSGGSPVGGLMDMFQHLNTEAVDLQASAVQTQTAGEALTPGEMIMLTMRCDEFMFHCELTSNIASRSSDGLQQLFREQS